MRWISLLKVIILLMCRIFLSRSSPDAVSTGDHDDAPWMWLSTDGGVGENNSGARVLEVVEVVDDPQEVGNPTDLKSEPRFVGHLRKKLCRVGLGLGQREVFCEPGHKTLYEGNRVRRSAQFSKLTDDGGPAGGPPQSRIEMIDRQGRVAQTSGEAMTSDLPPQHVRKGPRLLKGIGELFSKLPLQFFLGNHKNTSESNPSQTTSPSPTDPSIHPLQYHSESYQRSPYYQLQSQHTALDQLGSLHQEGSLHTSLKDIQGAPQGNLYYSGPNSIPGLLHPLSTTHFKPSPPSDGIAIPIHSGHKSPHSYSSYTSLTPSTFTQLDLDYTKRNFLDEKDFSLTTNSHDRLMNIKTHYINTGMPHKPDACSFVKCKKLSYFCSPNFGTLPRKPSQGPPATPARQGLVSDLPFSCGLNEVCCNLDNFDSSGNHVGVRVDAPLTPSSELRQCGRSTVGKVKGRITGALTTSGETKFGEFPWQAAILKKEGNDNVYVCAGSLVDKSHVLTAAHCVEGYTAKDLRVRLGEWDVNRDTEFYPHVEYDVIGVAVHPDFYSGNLINDISIIRMLFPIDFTKMPHISPVCLPSHGLNFAGNRCWVSGWGKNAFGKSGKYQNLLKKVDLPIIPRGTCNAILRETRLGPNYSLHPGMICAGGEPKRDACKGDGGGPLSCEDVDGHFVLSGIVSWGIGCGQPGVPGIYANVEYYVDWIQQMMES